MGFGLVAALVLAVFLGRRLWTTVGTIRAMAWTPVITRRAALWIRPHSYSEEEFFRADGAGEPWITRRTAALDRLATRLQTQHARSMAWGNAIRGRFSDLRFTDANRVRFRLRGSCANVSTSARW